MLYPLSWMFFASFKHNDEIFQASLLPSVWTLDGYRNGWKGSGQYTYATFFKNTFFMVLPMVAFTVISSSFVAFGFARFKFVGKKFCFALVMGCMMLPNAVMIIPRYIMYRDMGWLDSYLPFIIPCLFGGGSFFIFMFIQFFRGIPRELDESAYVDGCSSFMVYLKIVMPLAKPAVFSAMIFQFMWSWNDFFGPLLYINSVSKYPLALGLRMSMDVNMSVSWNNIIAMALVSTLPLVILFFCAQKYFVEGIAATGIKG
ncbi:MAG TPA: carbohydrate ABC transporter permease [Candidatus Eisenbergiella merdavium]|uniref:Carbohydrate ABC transporter permease n=1 Tax=Candidatus Eisenbergiella merdavium TaxID=2838551 RepID=A0A9D2NGV7_9FIRM|nr:carbohydrate ABC transporter permease [Candidatus Eisenbergiella merdavium]